MTDVKERPTEARQLERVTIRFAGDSGDGMQLTGSQFTRTAAVFGNDISTFPDFPAEIRAPAGSLPGVSGFQLSFASTRIHTPGDQPDVLVAMNPAALKSNLGDLPVGGALVVNEDAFTPANLSKVGYATNPLSDGSLSAYNVFLVPISKLNALASEGLELTNKQVDLTKNFFALGLMFWLYDRSMEPTLQWIDEKFSKRPVIAEGNKRALRGRLQLRRDDRDLPRALHRPAGPPGAGPLPEHHRQRGDRARLRGRVAARRPAAVLRLATRSRRPRTSSTAWPPTRTSASRPSRPRMRSRPSERRSARRYGGALGITGTSGPGIALKSEALGPGRHGRAAARHHRRPARRPVDRPADEDRAGRPPPDAVRAELGFADRDRRAGDAGRVLRHTRSRPGGSPSST